MLSSVIATSNFPALKFVVGADAPALYRCGSFPELQQLQDNWQMIRDEGLRLFDQGYIRTAAKYNDSRTTS